MPTQRLGATVRFELILAVSVDGQIERLLLWVFSLILRKATKGKKALADLLRPHTIVATPVVCADTDERVEELVASMALAWARMRSGRSGPLPSPEEALAHVYTPGELALTQTVRTQRIIGTPDQVKTHLESLIERTKADELMITTLVYGHENRVHILELLAQAFGLEGRAA